MTAFEAINHSMSLIPTGGFSNPHHTGSGLSCVLAVLGGLIEKIANNIVAALPHDVVILAASWRYCAGDAASHRPFGGCGGAWQRLITQPAWFT